MADDEAAVRARLAALEAEVKAESAVKNAAKAAALERLREQKAKKDAERQALVARQAAIVKKEPAPPAKVDKKPDKKKSSLDDAEGALELLRKGRAVKEELARPREANEKSWLVSGGLSLVLGPLGWLYAGSFREAIPASVAYLLIASILAKMPFMFVLMPAILIALTVSGFVGIFYAYQYNKHGSRQRLWGDKDKDKKLPADGDKKRGLLDD